uniref:Uncharacterized protein n=1 Tax=Salarias fasciatus TaxID=181472 RepID=A0A672HAT8_SALFA
MVFLNFLRDNAAAHNEHLIKDSCQENNITPLDDPACSPDLNPFEKPASPSRMLEQVPTESFFDILISVCRRFLDCFVLWSLFFVRLTNSLFQLNCFQKIAISIVFNYLFIYFLTCSDFLF